MKNTAAGKVFAHRDNNVGVSTFTAAGGIDAQACSSFTEADHIT
jgi:hypothetical protein